MNKILLLVFCMTTFLGFSQNSSSSSSQPNIVFIFSDDHSTNAISAYGGLFKKLAPQTKEQRDNGDKKRYVANGKIYYASDDLSSFVQKSEKKEKQQATELVTDDLPF